MERLIFIIKPLGFREGLKEEIIGMASTQADTAAEKLYGSGLAPETLGDLYPHHVGKPFFPGMAEYFSKPDAQIGVYILESKDWGEGFIKILRDIAGPTDPQEAREGQIRYLSPNRSIKDRNERLTDNLVHCSDGLGSAARECLIFFDDGIYDINRRLMGLDSLIEEQKAKEKREGAYVQRMDISNARRIAEGIKSGERVLLVGGLKEKEMIGEASGDIVNVDYIHTGEEDVIGDIESKLPLDAKSFDHAVMMNLFEILYNPARACLETYRLLKKGGKFWVSEPNSPGSHKSQGRGLLADLSGMNHLADQLRLRGLVHYPDGLDSYSVTPDFIRNAMELGGFFPEKISYEGSLVVALK